MFKVLRCKAILANGSLVPQREHGNMGPWFTVETLWEVVDDTYVPLSRPCRRNFTTTTHSSWHPFNSFEMILLSSFHHRGDPLDFGKSYKCVCVLKDRKTSITRSWDVERSYSTISLYIHPPGLVLHMASAWCSAVVLNCSVHWQWMYKHTEVGWEWWLTPPIPVLRRPSLG